MNGVEKNELEEKFVLWEINDEVWCLVKMLIWMVWFGVLVVVDVIMGLLFVSWVVIVLDFDGIFVILMSILLGYMVVIFKILVCLLFVGELGKGDLLVYLCMLFYCMVRKIECGIVDYICLC